MKVYIVALCTAVFLVTGQAFADGPKPTKVSAGDAAGPIFMHPDAVHEGRGTENTINVPLMLSGDEKFVAGMYSAGPSDMQFDGYPVDEFCYFVSGSVTLTSADGTVLTVEAGEAVTLPKGWKGRWQTEGYTKYYVVYAGEPIGE